MKENNISEIYSYCARQIKSVEKEEYNNKTLNDIFTIKGISYISLINPSLAYYYLPLTYMKPKIISYGYKALFVLNSIFIKLVNIEKFNNTDVFNKSILKSEIFTEDKDLVMFLNFTEKHFSQLFEPITRLDSYHKKYNTINVGLIDKVDTYPQVNIYNYYSLDDLNSEKHSFPDLFHLKYFRKKNIDEQRDSKKNIKIIKDYFFFLKNSLKNQFHIYVPFILMADKLLDELKPKIVISGDFCDPRCIALLLSAKAKKIPTMVIQQGIVSDVCSDFCFPITDVVAIWNTDTMDTLIKMGAEMTKFVITGNPGYDRIKKDIVEFSENNNNGKVKVLFISQPGHPHGIGNRKMKRMKIEIISSFEQVENFQLIIKPHPDEKNSYFAKEIKKRKLKNVILKNHNDNVTDLIGGSQIVIGFYSTAIIEAIAYDKDIMIYDEDADYNKFMPFEKENAAVGVNNGISIKQFLIEWENNNVLKEKLKNGRKNYLNKYLKNIDGKSSENIYILMSDLINKYR